MTPRIAFFGIFGRTNLGNEATLAAFLTSIRHRLPDVGLTCIGPGESTAVAERGVSLIPMEPMPVRHHFFTFRNRAIRSLAPLAQHITEPLRIRWAERQLRGYDALIIPGTGILDDFGQKALDLPHHLLRWCTAARHQGIPVFFLSVGAEPVPRGPSRTRLRRAAAIAVYRSYRDDESRQHAALLGVDVTADLIAPDLAFGLASETLPQPSPVHWPPRCVGLGVMGYYGWNEARSTGERLYQEYLEKLKRIVALLLERGCSVRLLTGDTRVDERPVRDLAEFFTDRMAQYPGGSLIAEPIVSFEDLLRQIADTDLVVGTRFHNVLLSLLMGRPAVSIGYSRKNDALLRQFGLQRYCQDASSFSVEEVTRQIDQLAREAPPLAAIRATTSDFRRQLDRQYDRILATFG